MTESEPQTRRLGYARVSTYGQTLDAQTAQLRAEGCTRIYREKASGAKADRHELLKLLKNLAPGDMVTVTRIDRLARSTFDLFAIVKRIVDAGGQFRSLAEPWADTATSTGRLMIAVLGGLADVERDLIRTRTAEGRSRAQARGQHMGRPPALTPQQQAEAANAAPRERPSRSWPRATTSGSRRFPASHQGRRDRGQKGSLLSGMSGAPQGNTAAASGLRGPARMVAPFAACGPPGFARRDLVARPHKFTVNAAATTLAWLLGSCCGLWSVNRAVNCRSFSR